MSHKTPLVTLPTIKVVDNFLHYLWNFYEYPQKLDLWSLYSLSMVYIGLSKIYLGLSMVHVWSIYGLYIFHQWFIYCWSISFVYPLTVNCPLTIAYLLSIHCLWIQIYRIFGLVSLSIKIRSKTLVDNASNLWIWILPNSLCLSYAFL